MLESVGHREGHMTDYMKCGDGPWCEQCAHKGDVEPHDVRYLCKNALGRCDFFRERSADEMGGEVSGESPATAETGSQAPRR